MLEKIFKNNNQMNKDILDKQDKISLIKKSYLLTNLLIKNKYIRFLFNHIIKQIQQSQKIKMEFASKTDYQQIIKQKTIKTVCEANQQMILTQSRLIKTLINQFRNQQLLNLKLNNQLVQHSKYISRQQQQSNVQINDYISLSENIKQMEINILCTQLHQRKNENEIKDIKKQLKSHQKKKQRRKQSFKQEVGRILTKSSIYRLIQQQIHKISLVILSPEDIQQIDDNLWEKQVNNYEKWQYKNYQNFKSVMKSIIKKKFIPQKYRKLIWPLLIQNSLFITKNLYNLLLSNLNQVPQKVHNFVKRDLDRSLIQENYINDITKFRNDVLEIMKLFHLYRPDISYTQGMLYPLIILMLNLDKYQAFQSFCNIIVANQFIHSLFNFNLKSITLYCRTFDKILQSVDKNISLYLQDLRIASENYLIQWFYTFFRKFGLATLNKIWDLFLVSSYSIFFKISVLILLELKSQLDGDFSTCLDIIKNFNNYIDQQEFIKKLVSFRLSKQSIDQIMSKIQIG